MEEDKNDMISDTLSTINIDQLTSSAMGAFNHHIHQLGETNVQPSVPDISLVSRSSNTTKTTVNNSSKPAQNSASIPAMPFMLSVNIPSTQSFQGTLPPVLPLIHRSGLHSIRHLISPLQTVVSPAQTASTAADSSSRSGEQTLANITDVVSKEPENLSSKLTEKLSTNNQIELLTSERGVSTCSFQEGAVASLSDVGLSNLQRLTSALLGNANVTNIFPSDDINVNVSIADPLSNGQPNLDLQSQIINQANSLFTSDSSLNSALCFQQILPGTIGNEQYLNDKGTLEKHISPENKLDGACSQNELPHEKVGQILDMKKADKEGEFNEDGESMMEDSQQKDLSSIRDNSSSDIVVDIGSVGDTLVTIPDSMQGVGEAPTDGVVLNGSLDLLSLQSQLLGSYLHTGTDLGDLACHTANALHTIGNSTNHNACLPEASEESCELETDPNGYQYFCAACNTALSSACVQHGGKVNHVVDTPGIPLSKARKSLPKCLYLKATSNSQAKHVPIGVFAYKTIPSNTKFGPFVGKVLNAGTKKPRIYSFPEWKIYDKGRLKVILAEDEEECNWMMFVHVARTTEKINLLAHQIGGALYFFVTGDIQEDEELLVWFSRDYSVGTGLPISPSTAKICECLICGKLFKSKTQLQLHLRETHGIIKSDKWKCNICMKVFRSQTNLEEHSLVCSQDGESSVASMSNSRQCVYCRQIFSDASNLKKHMFIHLNQRNYECESCCMVFRQKIHLQVHMATHTKEKLFKCQYCSKSFARKADCRTHEKWHKPEEGKRCEYCYKLFFKTQNFKRHMLIHTGQKDFECKKCSKRFYTKQHLQRHIKSCRVEKSYLYTLNEKVNLYQTHNTLDEKFDLQDVQKTLNGKINLQEVQSTVDQQVDNTQCT